MKQADAMIICALQHENHLVVSREVSYKKKGINKRDNATLLHAWYRCFLLILVE
jgi:hypothetical protein